MTDSDRRLVYIFNNLDDDSKKNLFDYAAFLMAMQKNKRQ
mgnify:CR=1 FL=1